MDRVQQDRAVLQCSLNTPGDSSACNRERSVLLHEAIAAVLCRNGNRPMHVEDIAAEINRLGLYRQRSGGPVYRKQVVARMKHARYKHLFEHVCPGHYRLA